MGNYFSNSLSVKDMAEWSGICQDTDPQYCARLAEYTLASAILSQIIYRCDSGADGASPLTREEFSRKLRDMQDPLGP